MKKLLLLLLTLSLISCIDSREVKIISTGERAKILDYNELYKKSDTILIYKSVNYDWQIDSNWSTKKDTTIGIFSYRIAIVTK